MGNNNAIPKHKIILIKQRLTHFFSDGKILIQKNLLSLRFSGNHIECQPIRRNCSNQTETSIDLTFIGHGEIEK